jgi:uncharacterized protein YaiI (UPF0178 family)
MFRIWVDADACPGIVRDILLRTSKRLGIPITFVANKPLNLSESDLVQVIQVSAGPDVVDDYLVEYAQSGDLAVTQDIPLADRLLSLGASVISPYGAEFTASNIGSRLGLRNLLQDLRDQGLASGGPRPFDDKAKQAFTNALDRTLTRLLKAARQRKSSLEGSS